MSTLTWRHGAWLLLAVVFAAFPAGDLAGQSLPVASGFDALRVIPGPEPITIPPFPFAAYGAMLAAARELHDSGTYEYLDAAIPGAELEAALAAGRHERT